MTLKPGDRIRLVAMGPDPEPVAPGSTGTVHSVVDMGDGTVHVNMVWDGPRSLNLRIPPDVVEVLR